MENRHLQTSSFIKHVSVHYTLSLHGFYMIPDDLRSQAIVDNRKSERFHVNANDPRADCGCIFSSAELSNTLAQLLSKMCTKNMADIEEEFLLRANLFLVFNR